MTEPSRKRRHSTTAENLVNEDAALYDENQRFRREVAQLKEKLTEFGRVKSNFAETQEQLKEKGRECARRDLDVSHMTNLNQEKRPLIDTYKQRVGDLESVKQDLTSAKERLETDKRNLGEDNKRVGTENTRLEASNAKLKREAEGRIEDIASKIEEIRKLKQCVDGIKYEPVDLKGFAVVSVRNADGHISPNKPTEQTDRTPRSASHEES